MTDIENKETIQRLDAMISLLIENLVVNGLIGKGRAIEILSASGLKPSEIGKIVDQPTTNIGSILSKQKKQKQRKKLK